MKKNEMIKYLIENIKIMFKDITSGDKERFKSQFANLLTLTRGVFAPALIVISLLKQSLELSFIIIFISALTDCFDGWYARKNGYVSEFGRLLDAICDKIFSLCIILPVISIETHLFIVILFIELMISLINIYLQLSGKVSRTSIIGKVKTIFLDATLVLCYLSLLLNIDMNIVKVCLTLTIVSQIITCIDYLIKLIKQVKIDKRMRKYLFLIILFITLFLGTYYFILRDYSIELLKESLKNCIPKFIMMAILLTILWEFFEVIYLKRMFKHFNYKITWAKAIGYVCTVQYFSWITPSSTGGQAVQMVEMKRDGIPYQVNAIVVLLNTVISKVALTVLAIIFFIAYFKKLFTVNTLFTVLVILGFVTTILVISMFVVLIYSKKIVNGVLKFIIKILRKLTFVKNIDKKEEKLKNIIKEYQEYAKITKEHPRMLLEAFMIMLCQRLANLAISYAIYLSFGLTEMSIFEVIAFQICITLGSDLMPSPGGIGVNEGMLLEANKLIYGSGFATSGMILFRSISFYAVLLISAMVYIIFHFAKRKKTVLLDVQINRNEIFDKENV